LPVFTFSPLTDPRWPEFVSRHPRAGVFHTSAWLSALAHTYRYEPLVFTTNVPTQPLNNGLVFCEVNSWITGRRLVSLPFSDHCDWLADSTSERDELLSFICDHGARQGYRHIELRPKSSAPSESQSNLQPSLTFCLHTLDLKVPAESLFKNLHPNCMQRKIRRAEKENLHYQSGRSSDLLRAFYHLQLRTRRRHSLPPQPFSWFRNLAAAMGENLTIRLLSKDEHPVAAILTLSHGTTMTFKYGCSDERFHKLGGIPFLLWKAIEEAKAQGAHELDLGRSELSQPGLIQFKDRLGAVRYDLPYWRFPREKAANATHSGWSTRMAKAVFSAVPEPIFVASGNLLYRHIG
jgi:lipid II:glycine glycyltransferase (peptidoglycan interpeptide bridge formation enzyme)